MFIICLLAQQSDLDDFNSFATIFFARICSRFLQFVEPEKQMLHTFCLFGCSLVRAGECIYWVCWLVISL